jgi:hypothetical protein
MTGMLSLHIAVTPFQPELFMGTSGFKINGSMHVYQGRNGIMITQCTYLMFIVDKGILAECPWIIWLLHSVIYV